MLRRQPTLREIEIKLRFEDASDALKRLHRLGAKPRGRVLERNTVFDTSDHALYSRGRLLRLRVEIPAPTRECPGGPRREVLTSKAPPPPVAGRLLRRGRYKERLEREVTVRNARLWPSILKSLGFRSRFRYEKYRTFFRLPGLHLDMDETPVGTFLELEGAPRAIDRVARALGFSPRDYIRGTYWDLYLQDCRQRGRTPRDMLFNAKKSL